ncbi:MAG: succinoglycan biosynthesis protein [Caulobacter sp.]|nr:succinoglycan biosynthesis protein [Caulobacter sp.]
MPTLLATAPQTPPSRATPPTPGLEPGRALIVVPTLNEEAFIGALLDRLLEDDGLTDPLVVVADGGSKDATRAIVQDRAAVDPRVRLLDNPKRLQSAGINLAVERYAGDRDWIVRVDAHAIYPHHYASRLIAEGRRTGAESVVVAMETRGEGGFQKGAAAAQNSRLGTGGSAHRSAGVQGFVDHGHHALFSRAAFVAAGGYDETFSHNEDAEFDLRLRANGGRVWLTSAPRLTYYPRRTPAALWRQYFNYGRGRARTMLKHRVAPKLRQAAPMVIAPIVLMALGGLAYAPMALPALAWAAACLIYGAALALRARDASTLLSGPAAMIMHLAWSAGFWSQVLRRSAASQPAPSSPSITGSAP